MVTGSKLVGMAVITSDAYKLGQIEGTELDADTWKVTHLRIDLTDEAIRELAFRKPFLGGIRVCLPVSHVSKLADVVTLKSSLADVKASPECKGK